MELVLKSPIVISIHYLVENKQKVRLALLRHEKGNVLILDEPTNHLDVQAKEALKDALINYQGTLILVSHEKGILCRHL